MGAPIFTAEYLRWLYGGPDRARHFILACRLAGRLVGLRALLDRRVSSGGKIWTAYLSTHLAIHPDVGDSLRREVRDHLLQPLTLLTDDSEASNSRARNVLVAFFDDAKQALIGRTAHRASSEGVTMSRATFHQAVVSPAALEARVREVERSDTRVRPVDDRDCAGLAQLFDRVAGRQPFAFAMNADQLRHHILGVPRGRSDLVEERGAPSGFITYYVMEILKASGPSRVVVVDLLVCDGTGEAARLLAHEALHYARASEARGVVIENPTYLDIDTRRSCGIVPSTRRMVITTRSRTRAFECDGGFLCDVK
jgi:hypothetical protein